MGRCVRSVLLGVFDDRRATAFLDGLKWTLESSDNVEVSRIERGKIIDDIDTMASSGAFDVLFCCEELGDRSVGYGSVNRWGGMPLKRIILILKNSQYGGAKCSRLFEQGYYDAIFTNDLKEPELVIDLVLNGRTMEEAAAYYGIDEEVLARMKQSEAPDIEPVPTVAGKDLRAEMLADFEALLNEADETPVASTSKKNLSQNTGANGTFESKTDFSGVEESVERANRRPGEKETDGNIAVKENSGKGKQVEADFKEEKQSAEKMVSKEVRLDENSIMVVTRVQKASVVPHEAYIVAAVSDSALIIEVPGAHFERLKSALPNMSVNVVMPHIWEYEDKD